MFDGKHLSASTGVFVMYNKLSSERIPSFFFEVAVAITAKPCVLENLLARINGEVGVERPLPTPNKKSVLVRILAFFSEW